MQGEIRGLGSVGVGAPITTGAGAVVTEKERVRLCWLMRLRGGRDSLPKVRARKAGSCRSCEAAAGSAGRKGEKRRSSE